MWFSTKTKESLTPKDRGGGGLKNGKQRSKFFYCSRKSKIKDQNWGEEGMEIEIF